MTDTAAPAHVFNIGETVSILHDGVRKDGRIREIKKSSGQMKWRVEVLGLSAKNDIMVGVGKEAGLMFPNPNHVEPEPEKASTPKPTKGKKKASSSLKPETSHTFRRAEESKALISTQPRLHVELPDKFKRILVDDRDLISRYFLVKLPAKYTIDQIITEYIQTIPVAIEDLNNDELEITENEEDMPLENHNACLVLIARGLVNFFNQVIGFHLLYQFERPQYNDIIINKEGTGVVENESIRFSAHYGLIHFLRMLSRLTDLFPSWKHEALKKRFFAGAADLVVFLNNNHRKYYHEAEEYVSATLPYYKRANPIEETEDVDQPSTSA